MTAPAPSLWRSDAPARASTRRRLASPPSTLVSPPPVALAGGEDRAAGGADRVEERQVLTRGGRLGELDVVDDLARAGGVQAAHRAAVQRARERPLLLRAVEGLGVDRDDDDVVGPLGPAQVEAGLERLALEPVERAASSRPRRPRRTPPARRSRARARGSESGSRDEAARHAALASRAAARDSARRPRAATRLWRTLSRTITEPLVTRVSVPAQVSTDHPARAAHGGVAVACRACGSGRRGRCPRGGGRSEGGAPRSRRRRPGRRCRSACTHGHAGRGRRSRAWPWRITKRPPPNRPVWVAPEGSADVSASVPRRASISEPSGSSEPSSSGTKDVVPGRRTCKWPAAGATRTLEPSSGAGGVSSTSPGIGSTGSGSDVPGGGAASVVKARSWLRLVPLLLVATSRKW